MDPGTILQGAGAVAGGIGGLIGAFSGGSGPPMMDPAIQALIATGQLDLAEYQAQTMAAQWGIDTGWKQEWAKYGAEVQQALEKHYAENFGVADKFAREFVGRVAAGQPTDATVNLLSGQLSMEGRNRGQMMDQVNQQIAASGLDPNSPAAQEMKNKAMSNLLAGETARATQLLGDRQQMEQQTAQQLLGWMSDPNRLRGIGWEQDAEGNWVRTGAEIPDTYKEDWHKQQEESLAEIDAQLAELGRGQTGRGRRYQSREDTGRRAKLQQERERIAGMEFQYPGEGGVDYTVNWPVTTFELADAEGRYERGRERDSGPTGSPGSARSAGASGGVNYLGHGQPSPQRSFIPGQGWQGYTYQGEGRYRTEGGLSGRDDAYGSAYALDYLKNYDPSWANTGQGQYHMGRKGFGVDLQKELKMDDPQWRQFVRDYQARGPGVDQHWLQRRTRNA